MRPTKSRVGLQNGPWDPRGDPEANQGQKDVLGSAQGTLLGGSPRERREQFYIVKTMLFARFAFFRAGNVFKHYSSLLARGSQVNRESSYAQKALGAL